MLIMKNLFKISFKKCKQWYQMKINIKKVLNLLWIQKKVTQNLEIKIAKIKMLKKLYIYQVLLKISKKTQLRNKKIQIKKNLQKKTN